MIYFKQYFICNGNFCEHKIGVEKISVLPNYGRIVGMKENGERNMYLYVSKHENLHISKLGSLIFVETKQTVGIYCNCTHQTSLASIFVLNVLSPNLKTPI